jgi:aspartate beta-hydroxylase
VIIFDDSFEHEIWNAGTGTRLLLIFDVWHPDLADTDIRAILFSRRLLQDADELAPRQGP